MLVLAARKIRSRIRCKNGLRTVAETRRVVIIYYLFGKIRLNNVLFQIGEDYGLVHEKNLEMCESLFQSQDNTHPEYFGKNIHACRLVGQIKYLTRTFASELDAFHEKIFLYFNSCCHLPAPDRLCTASTERRRLAREAGGKEYSAGAVSEGWRSRGHF